MNKIVGCGLASGLIAGLVTFAYTRWQIAPLVEQAVGFEEARSHAEQTLTGEHAHEHEVFTRVVQENVGAGTGIVAYGLIVGALFAVAFWMLTAFLARRRIAADPRWVSITLAVAGFVAVTLVPFMVLPANPPGVGHEDSAGARTAGYLAALVASVLLAAVATVVAARLIPRIGRWSSVMLAGWGYVLAVCLVTAALPRFDEVPTPLLDTSGAVVFPGFPAALLADFRADSLIAAALMWAVLGTAFSMLLHRTSDRKVAYADR
ncbi:CbtA family protein [Mycobacterium hackensackense]|uniref:CbtA family protein n=1 Tax=Mycobacterium hackensackense TaxID=228909 RepID=UPI0022659D70|nr:CbtA family protein [Mycobacterium hackensackense]MCV7252744.1 CbtA family protein [Mycobacterium hackensackense]